MSLWNIIWNVIFNSKFPIATLVPLISQSSPSFFVHNFKLIRSQNYISSLLDFLKVFFFFLVNWLPKSYPVHKRERIPSSLASIEQLFFLWKELPLSGIFIVFTSISSFHPKSHCEKIFFRFTFSQTFFTNMQEGGSSSSKIHYANQVIKGMSTKNLR